MSARCNGEEGRVCHSVATPRPLLLLVPCGITRESTFSAGIEWVDGVERALWHCAVRARKAVQMSNLGSDYAVASTAGALPAWSRVPPVVAPGACGESDRSCHQGYSIEEVVIRVRKPALMLSRCLEATVRVFKHVVCACVRACACVRVPASRSCCKGPRGNKLSCRL